MNGAAPSAVNAAELERWNTRYAGERYWFGAAPSAFLVAQLHRLPAGARVLCVADGEGRNGVWLASRGHRVTAFDFSPEGVAKAQRLAAAQGVAVDFQQADVNDWNWTETPYDAVVAIFVQFATPAERERMFAGIVTALRPGGVLLLQGYRPEQLALGTGGPKIASHFYTEPLLQEQLAALEIVYLESHDSALAEGEGHAGPSALIDLVGIKAAV